jgi:prolipoprotein diacylglyceryltransferase
MGINININPVLFTLGGLEVRWYGVMMAIGVAVLITWAFQQVKRGAKITYDHLLGAAMVPSWARRWASGFTAALTN